MLNSPHLFTSTFALGIACGVLITYTVLRLWHAKRRHLSAVRVSGDDALPPDVEATIRAKARMFAEAAGQTDSAPLVYTAVRDLALAKAVSRRGTVSIDEVDS